MPSKEEIASAIEKLEMLRWDMARKLSFAGMFELFQEHANSCEKSGLSPGEYERIIRSVFAEALEKAIIALKTLL